MKSTSPEALISLRVLLHGYYSYFYYNSSLRGYHFTSSHKTHLPRRSTRLPLRLLPHGAPSDSGFLEEVIHRFFPKPTSKKLSNDVPKWTDDYAHPSSAAHTPCFDGSSTRSVEGYSKNDHRQVNVCYNFQELLPLPQPHNQEGCSFNELMDHHHQQQQVSQPQAAPFYNDHVPLGGGSDHSMGVDNMFQYPEVMGEFAARVQN